MSIFPIKSRSTFLLISIGLLVLWIPKLHAKVVTVDPGKSEIVVAADAPIETRFAAGELQKHLKLITGTEIPIVEQDKASEREGLYPFYVGITYPGDESPLKPEEARRHIGKEAAYLYGDDGKDSRAVDFAVYNFLEDELGVHWIFPGDKGIAYEKQSPLKLEEGAAAWAPELLLRKIRTSWRKGRYPILKGRDYVRDFTEYVRTNEEHDACAEDVLTWQKRMRMGQHNLPPYGHAFTTWWKKYGKTHPEYFALNKFGKREPLVISTRPEAIYTKDNPRGFQEIKMCTASSELVRQIIKNWIDRGGSARSKWINVCENDGAYGYCEGEECLKLDVPRPGEKPMAHLTDRYVHLTNAVAREARKIDPEAGAVMYAYDRYMLPPRREKVEPNVAVGFVPTTVDLDRLEELYGGWEAAGARLLLMRPNYHTYYNVMVIPAGFAEHMYKVFQVAYKHGARAADYDSLFGMWSITGLSDYVLARTFSDPEKPFEYWVDQYCSAFGAASDDMKRYFAYWRNELWDKRLLPDLDKLAGRHNFNFSRNLMQVLDKYYTPADFDATDAILQDAAKKDLTDIQRAKLNDYILANEHARLTYNAAVAKGQDKFVQALKLLDFRKQHKDDLNINWIGTFAEETRFFGDVTGVKKAAALRAYDLPWLETGMAWRFKMDPENVGKTEKWQLLTHEQTADWGELRIDSNWENPYDSETDPALAAKLKNYDGVAWYRSRIHLPEEMKGRRIFLYFGGIDESCWVYVNGDLAGSKVSEGTKEVGPFTIEIGDQINWNENFQYITIRVEDKGGRGGIPKRIWVVSKSRGFGHL